MFDFLAMKKSFDSLQKQHDDLCDELRAVNYKIVQTRVAPANKADLHEVVDLWVKRSAAGFAPAVAANMVKQQRAGVAGAANVGFFSLVKDDSDDLKVSAMDGVMCAVFGDQIKKAIVSAIEGMDWPGEGLPRAKREAEVERLEKLSRNLTQEIETLKQGAHEAGIVIR
jgi:hypothetical protein